MRVVVDASIVKPQQTGISTYICSLCTSMNSHVNVSVLTSEPTIFDVNNVEITELPRTTQSYGIRQLWRERHLGRLATKLGADVVLVPVPEAPLRRMSVPVVCVVHDVGPLVDPHYYSFLKKARFRLMLGTLGRADAIVAVSNSTANDMRKVAPRTGHLLSVIGEGVTELPDPRSPTKSIGSAPYVLYVGSALRHKNLDTLAQAARLLKDARLVMAGPGTEIYGRATENVIGLGWMPADEIAGLMMGARLIVNPSIHEGFGLPTLEAMAMGRPTLVSDLEVFREVAGNVANYVGQTLCPSAWAEAINDLLGNQDRLAEMSSSGIERARSWTWAQSAKEFFNLFVTLTRVVPQDEGRREKRRPC